MERNIGLEVAEFLVGTFGFEDGDRPGRFQLVIDAQHIAVVDVLPWKETPPFGGPKARADFGMARRDVNEVWSHVLDNKAIKPAHPLMEAASNGVLGQPRGRWRSRNSIDEIEGWLHEWVPRLVAEAPSLQFLQQYLKERIDPDLTGEGAVPNQEIAAANYGRTTAAWRMADRLLDGLWEQADFE